jgi:catechol 2,3-dioxygenase-like lactoylglutathione lyase family enzyme
MTVRSTESSLTFYRDQLGLTVTGMSLNVGTEQEYLDSLRGAKVRVTGLKPLAGATGIEFLEYELPAAGRPMPADARPNDLVHWQVTLVVNDAEAVATRLRTSYPFVSSAVVTMPDGALGFTKGFLVRDPDGHVMQIVER